MTDADANDWDDFPEDELLAAITRFEQARGEQPWSPTEPDTPPASPKLLEADSLPQQRLSAKNAHDSVPMRLPQRAPWAAPPELALQALSLHSARSWLGVRLYDLRYWPFVLNELANSGFLEFPLILATTATCRQTANARWFMQPFRLRLQWCGERKTQLTGRDYT